MEENYKAQIIQSLQEVAQGTFEIIRHNALEEQSAPLVEQISAQTCGKGRIETYLVFPGIEVSVHRYWAQRVKFHHGPFPFVLEMNHCRTGRIGWNMLGSAVYLGPGDLCVHSLESCADSEMTLPLGCYEGIAVTLDLQRLRENCPDIPRQGGFDASKIFQKFCVGQKPLGIPAGSAVERLFSVLYDLPQELRLPYYKLKAQEALLYLQQLEPDCGKRLTQYGARQTESIRQIHDFLIQNLDERFTIEELAKKYLLNTSTLKSVFKAVYGMPIAAYVKEYRIQKAMQLLRDTDDTIAAIAQKVGYETQGKFTKAFKESCQILPTEYRRLCRKNF